MHKQQLWYNKNDNDIFLTLNRQRQNESFEDFGEKGTDSHHLVDGFRLYIILISWRKIPYTLYCRYFWYFLCKNLFTMLMKIYRQGAAKSCPLVPLLGCSWVYIEIISSGQRHWETNKTNSGDPHCDLRPLVNSLPPYLNRQSFSFCWIYLIC